MNDEPRISERDLVKRELLAWRTCAEQCVAYLHDHGRFELAPLIAEGIRRFPLPPHAETDSEGVSWRISQSGGIEYRWPTGESSWFSLPSSLNGDRLASPRLTVERLDLLTTLRTEETP